MASRGMELLRVLRRFWRALGPGVITGAADDDPSGIATYSVAGAQYGTIRCVGGLGFLLGDGRLNWATPAPFLPTV